MTIQDLFDEYVSVSKDYQVSGIRQQQIIQEVEALVRKETVQEVFNLVKSVESYCIQPSGYCNEEQEKEIYLYGFDDMRAYKIINIINWAKSKGVNLD